MVRTMDSFQIRDENGRMRIKIVWMTDESEIEAES